MAPQAGAGGMSEQEQKYVKIVWRIPYANDATPSLIASTDTIGHGIMCGQVYPGRRNGFCIGGRFWSFHFQCTSSMCTLIRSTLSLDELHQLSSTSPVSLDLTP